MGCLLMRKKKESQSIEIKINLIGIIGFVIAVLGVLTLPVKLVQWLLSLSSIGIAGYCIYEYQHWINVVTILISIMTIVLSITV